MRRKLTDSERAAAAEKRRELLAAEKAATDAERAAAVAAVRFVGGAEMSPKNAWLVVRQAAAAGVSPSVVGGFRQWRAAGRVVRKGARGLLICYPRTVKSEETGADVLAGFGWAYVWDVSQTVERGAAGADDAAAGADDDAAADDAATAAAVPAAAPAPAPAPVSVPVAAAAETDAAAALMALFNAN